MSDVKDCPDTGMQYIEHDGCKRYLASIPSGGKMKAMLPGYEAAGNPMFDKKDWFELSRRGRGGVFDTIFDQKSHGSCVGNGWAGALGRARVLRGAKSAVLSPAWTYSLINGNRDQGAVISDGIEALTKYGTCLYSTVGEDPIYQSQMPGGAKAEATRFKLRAAYHCSSWAEVISALLTGLLIPVYGFQVGNNFMRFDKYGVAGHDRGPGNHCVPPETIISGPEMKEAKDVQVGDRVFGHDGKPHEVRRVFRRYYNGSLVRIAGPGATRIEATEEHPVLVYRWARVDALAVAGAVHGSPSIPATKFKTRNYEAHWIKAKDVRPGDYLVTPKVELPASSGDAEWDFFVGYYAGNGSLIVEKNRGAKGVHVDLPLDGPIDRIEAVLSRFGKPTRIWRGMNGKLVEQGEATSLRFRLSNKAFAERMLSLVGRRSSSKRLPNLNAAAMEGLLAADGHRHAGNPNLRVFNTTSRVLAQQVRLLAVATGERPTFAEIKANRPGVFANAKPSWRVCWTEGGKSGASRFAGSVLLTPVRSVLFVPYTGEVFNFEVADVNSYLADTLATHNCNGADGVKLLADGRWVLDDFNSWNTSFGDGGRCYLDEQHLFGGGDEPDVCVVQAFEEDPTDVTGPPVAAA